MGPRGYLETVRRIREGDLIDVEPEGASQATRVGDEPDEIGQDEA